ncbi:FAD-dependent oxidoreductase [Nisaea acidiphila]|uniref:FAD-dependent oxidoreductase n=1 Tax=Nisaea acidiphila TaxID=1862145 RepID=A0A9J7APK2_9PROT|nr:FAD-dependent oxidoreductase [Nisaea acidiphila]UUX49547.1 FAD-dependent oxidoreductase [Nisaea acidiphila]
MSDGSKRIIVIGAGIVGTATALRLAMDGHKVRVIDPKPPGRATSFGNAGAIASGAVTPTGSPGNFRQLPKMLLDPAGPVSIRWSYLPKLAPWLMRFFAASTPARVEQISKELWTLTAPAGDAHLALMKAHRIEGIVKPLGWLKVYTGEASFASTKFERGLLEKRGVNLQILNRDELRQLEPGLAPTFTHGAFQPDNHFVTSPVKLTEAYAEAFTRLGGTFIAEQVRRFEFDGNRVSRVITDLAMHEADAVAVCTGAWSARVCAMMGLKVPLDTERGYHLNLVQEDAPKLGRPVVIGDHGFVLAPMQDGIRLTSGVEFAGLDAEPDFTRIKRMLPLARKALPGLGGTVTREWLGHRPSTPDSKPVIGAAPEIPNVFLGFGHGHLGLTLAARTADLLAGEISGREPDIDLAPFSAARF